MANKSCLDTWQFRVKEVSSLNTMIEAYSILGNIIYQVLVSVYACLHVFVCLCECMCACLCVCMGVCGCEYIYI